MDKIRIYIIAGAVIALLLLMGTVKVLYDKMNREKAEKELYVKNTRILLDTLQTYRTKDSLHVASVGKLELKLSEYEKYRAGDMKLISSLKADKKNLESVATMQTQTIYELKGSVRDSIVHRDKSVADTLRCITIRDKWFDMNGCINKLDEFSGRFENRDSLAVVNHVKQKRFLGFLWYYGKKESRIDAVSKNPNTKIKGIEYIEIRD
ncbi:DUF6549 family protein [Dysgonomonas termitidis]